MPIYCYECSSCGEVTEVFCHSHRHRGGADGTKNAECSACGGLAGRSFFAEAGRARPASVGELRSVSAGVMPEQAAAAERDFARRGIDGVRFDRATGDAIFRDRPTKLRAIKAMGLHDKNEIRG